LRKISIDHQLDTAAHHDFVKLVDAICGAREQSAAQMKTYHKKAMAEARAAHEELEIAKRALEEDAARLKPSDAPKPPIKFKDAVRREFSFPWHICKTWKEAVLEIPLY
jgi:molybdenum-dependent DNA-binding transcriptional regulator ModE